MTKEEIIKEFRTLRATGLYDDPLSDNQEEVLLDFWLSKLEAQIKDIEKGAEKRRKVLKALLKDFKEGKIICLDDNEYAPRLNQTKGRYRELADFKQLLNKL